MPRKKTISTACPYWKNEIIALFDDFLLSKEKAKKIIERVELKYPNSSDLFKYERCWNIFKELI